MDTLTNNRPDPWLPWINLLAYLLAWLSFALIANLTAFLVSIGYTGGVWGEKAWTGLILALSFLLALAFLWRKKDMAAALTFVWAWSGLIVRHYGDPVLQGLNLLLYFIAGLTVLAVLYVLLKPGLRRGKFSASASTSASAK